MFERYPLESIRMLFLARANAAAAGAAAIEVEHLLAGALAARDAVPPGGDPQIRGAESQIPFSDHVQMLLNRAVWTADNLGHHRILTEHVLIALVDDSDLHTVAAVRGAGLDRSALVQSAERHAAIDDSPLSYRARARLQGAKPRTENQ